MRVFFSFQLASWVVAIFCFSIESFAETDILSPPYESQAPEYEVVFNTPGFQNQPDTSIERKLIELIRSAVPDSSIRVSIYTFTNQKIAQELLAANARGVSVEIIIDGKSKKHLNNPGHAVQLLTTTQNGKAALSCHSDNCVTFCSSLAGSSCRGLHINHNKFILFSQLKDGSKNVVTQTSYNFNQSQNFQYNDLIIIKNDPQLYGGYLRYWYSLKKDKVKMIKVGSFHGLKGTKAFLFPRLVGSDPVLNILNTVRCDPAGSNIRIVQSRFDRFRSKIIRRLVTLRNQGCNIKVIVRTERNLYSPTPLLRSLLGRDVTVLDYKDKQGRTLQRNSVHSKVILIDAAINGSKEKTSLVLTGSHNLDLTSLRTNDEVMLSIPDREVYEQYLHFWETILEDATNPGLISPNFEEF